MHSEAKRVLSQLMPNRTPRSLPTPQKVSWTFLGEPLGESYQVARLAFEVTMQQIVFEVEATAPLNAHPLVWSVRKLRSIPPREADSAQSTSAGVIRDRWCPVEGCHAERPIGLSRCMHHMEGKDCLTYTCVGKTINVYRGICQEPLLTEWWANTLCHQCASGWDDWLAQELVQGRGIRIADFVLAMFFGFHKRTSASESEAPIPEGLTRYKNSL